MSTPIVINPQLVGNWRAALTNDQVVSQHLNGSALDSNNYNNALKAYQNAPATGCATIIDQVRSSQGYNPLDPAQAGNLQAFTNWINGVKATNFFNESINDVIPVGGVNNWQAYLSQAISLYVGITSADASRIQASILTLVAASYTMPGYPETVVMVQQTIQANNDNSISAYFYYTTAQIIYKPGDKNSSSVLSSTFSVKRVKLDMPLANWQSRAAEVAKNKVSLVSSWLKGMQSNSGARAMMAVEKPKNDLSCFRQVPGLIDARFSGNANDYWFAFDWNTLPSVALSAFQELGWDAKKWMDPFKKHPAVMDKKWDELTTEEQKSARTLCYTEQLWDGPGVLKGIHSGDIRAYWNEFPWSSIAPAFQQRWEKLGWNESNWSDLIGNNPNTSWSSLTADQKSAAYWLGFTETSY